LRKATWEEYERLAAKRGERSVPRIAFLEGVVELMTPSWPHESLKTRIGRLVEVWCLEHDIEFSAGGSWTLKSKKTQRAVEADECYIFGNVTDPKRPDLAIEIERTSGGLDKLDIYRKIGVREVWFWRKGRISVHELVGQQYVERLHSVGLPGLDLVHLASFLDHPSTSAAIKSRDSGDELSPSRSAIPGRKPYFAIHARTVLRVMSSTAAVREMFHPVWASASIRRSRSDPAASLGIEVPRALT